MYVCDVIRYVVVLFGSQHLLHASLSWERVAVEIVKPCEACLSFLILGYIRNNQLGFNHGHISAS